MEPWNISRILVHIKQTLRRRIWALETPRIPVHIKQTYWSPEIPLEYSYIMSRHIWALEYPKNTLRHWGDVFEPWKISRILVYIEQMYLSTGIALEYCDQIKWKARIMLNHVLYPRFNQFYAGSSWRTVVHVSLRSSTTCSID